jgi:hypothetical protein
LAATCSNTNAGGVTPWRRAHASFCSSAIQQQRRQQLSASAHGHGQSWQGNGRERSFTTTGMMGTPHAPAMITGSISAATQVRRRMKRHKL